jgi:hypothetical protein
MTKKAKESTYSVAMSKDSGAIVFLRTNGHQVTVIGAMSREESVDFVRGIMEWTAETIQDEAPRIMRLNG